MDELSAVITADSESTDAWPEAATLRSVLHVLVVCHPRSFQALDLARGLLRRWMRDPREPSERGIGLPVFFHPASLAEDSSRDEIADVEFDLCDREVVIVFLDDAFIVDDRWERFLKRLVANDGVSGRRRVFPVALTKAAFRSAAQSLQIIDLAGLAAEDAAEKLEFEVTHEACRFLMNVPRRADGRGQPSASPVQVFASYARRDGQPIAEAIAAFIQKDTQLDVFLDLNSIPPGSDFIAELEGAVETAALLIIQTDAYSSRYWCQHELLWAKQHGCPIVVVHAVTGGERRVFPYLGNVPSVRWRSDEPQCRQTLSVLLHEVLRVLAFRCMDWSNVEKDAVVLPRPPELINLVEPIKWSDTNGTATDLAVVYPDPPLADVELDLLGRVAPHVRFITPTTRHSRRRGTLPLQGARIALSISQCDDAASRGLAAEHLDDAFVELARHLLALGATLCYGGDLRVRGYTEILAELVRNHNTAGSASWARIRNYLAWPDDEPPVEILAARKPDVEFVVVGRPAGHDTDDAIGWLRATVLSTMRARMTQDCRARVVLGGQGRSYQGFYPGIIEETWHAVAASQPVYLIGGFGGVTDLLVHAREKGAPHSLESAFALSTAVERRAAARARDIEVPSVDRLREDLVRRKWPSNGLTASQDRQLTRSRDVTEIVSLVVQGLIHII